MTKSFLLVVLLLSACAATEVKVKSVPTYKISRQQVGAEPVYSSLRWVNLPDPLPDKGAQPNSKNFVDPVYQFELKNSSLEESSYIFATALHYRSYCASGIANQHVTFSTLGTIAEIAEKLEKLAGIKIVIDHDNREVRFLSGEGAITPTQAK